MIICYLQLSITVFLSLQVVIILILFKKIQAFAIERTGIVNDDSFHMLCMQISFIFVFGFGWVPHVLKHNLSGHLIITTTSMYFKGQTYKKIVIFFTIHLNDFFI